MMHRYNTRSNDRSSSKKDKLTYDLTIVEEKEEEVGYTDKEYAELIVDEVLDQYSSKYGVDLDSDKIFKLVEKTLQRSKGLSDKRQLEAAAEEEEEEEEETVSNSEEEEEEEASAVESEADYESEEEYYEELVDAISHVRKLGKKAGKVLLNGVMDKYKLETGEYPSLSELEESVNIVKECLLSDESTNEADNVESVCDVVSVLEFADDLETALDVAGKIGEMHQEYLVNQICEQFMELNEEEPTLDELFDIVGRLKDILVEEAMDELADDISSDVEYEYEEEEEEELESDEDEDYCITAEDIVQSIKDQMDLKAIDSENEEEYSENDDNEIVESEEEEESNNDEECEDSEDDSDYDPNYDEQDYTGDYQLYR